MIKISCRNHFSEQVDTASVTGRRNLKRCAKCEDIIRTDTTSDLHMFGLADGQSGKKYCREGGKEVLNAVFKFIAAKGITQLLQYEHIDELQYELIKVVRDTISALALSEGADKTEFASTLVILAYDIYTGNYILVHLGDGCIMAQKADKQIFMLSAPENGLTTSYTWLTTSQEALAHLRIGFGNIGAYKRIMILTDGATVYAYGKNIPATAEEIIKNNSREEIISFLHESNPSDDASCIIIDFLSNNLVNDY